MTGVIQAITEDWTIMVNAHFKAKDYYVFVHIKAFTYGYFLQARVIIASSTELYFNNFEKTFWFIIFILYFDFYLFNACYTLQYMFRSMGKYGMLKVSHVHHFVLFDNFKCILKLLLFFTRPA